MTDKTYNGWKNYETWNVALYIQNEYGLYQLAQEIDNYETFIDMMRELGSLETPDQVAWNDSGIDRDRINEMLKEL